MMLLKKIGDLARSKYPSIDKSLWSVGLIQCAIIGCSKSADIRDDFKKLLNAAAINDTLTKNVSLIDKLKSESTKCPFLDVKYTDVVGRALYYLIFAYNDNYYELLKGLRSLTPRSLCEK